MSEQRPWHHLFGLSWMDFFHGTTVTVEEEKDLSHRHQFLDLVVVRADDQPPPRRPPDGFDDLAAHNLITFKSYQEALNDWALIELLCYYGNYRKQAGGSMREEDLLPPASFRLIAVCVRFPHNLAGQVTLTRRSAGVYEVMAITKPIRVVVIHELPSQPHNAMLLLFSAKKKQRTYGASHFQQHSPNTSTLLLHFARQYHEEGIPMPETLEEFVRRTRREVIEEATTEERRKIIEEATSEERRALLQGLSPAELLEALSPEAIEELKRRLKDQELPDKPE